jgi:hypothetical protein
MDGMRTLRDAEEHDIREREKKRNRLGVIIPTVEKGMAVRIISALQSSVFHIRVRRAAYAGLWWMIGY